MKTDEEILAEVKQATKSLFVMSESDYPVATLFLDGGVALSPERLRELAGADASAVVETRSFDDFIRSTTFEKIWKEDGAQTVGAESYIPLEKLLKDNLSELRVYRVGKINIPVFVVGKSPEGNWIGLSTRVVET